MGNLPGEDICGVDQRRIGRADDASSMSRRGALEGDEPGPCITYAVRATCLHVGTLCASLIYSATAIAGGFHEPSRIGSLPQ